ncbi:MAG: hypothetical protein RJA19_1090 [Bacteroidota bacterium]|jgi:exopolyphosphatase/guanosine-5'-triphosphate,3'-diphosphate pyrophosphatase
MSGGANVAVIDCGTNTFTLSVVSFGRSPWVERFAMRVPVRLGAGGFKAGVIRPDRFARGVDAMRILQEAARNYAVTEFKALGTSALRDASNREAFVAAVREATGISIAVIDGAQEAGLIWRGVRRTLVPGWMGEGDAPLLVVDIGGGSVETVVVVGGEVRWWHSFDWGVARLMEWASPADPLGREGRQKLEPFLHSVLTPLHDALAQWKPVRLVGASGFFETLVDLNEPGRARVPDAPREVGEAILLEVPMSDWRNLRDQLWSLDLGGRMAMPGMAPERALYMPLAAVWLDHVLEGMQRILSAEGEAHPSAVRWGVSPFSLREGVLDAWSRGEDPVNIRFASN